MPGPSGNPFPVSLLVMGGEEVTTEKGNTQSLPAMSTPVAEELHHVLHLYNVPGLVHHLQVLGTSALAIQALNQVSIIIIVLFVIVSP